jgi:hypothetical protein
MATDECPRISDTTFSGTPWVSMTLAAECRSVCSPVSGRPARTAATFSARKAFRGSQGSPNSVVNTKAVSCQAVPARDRSSAWVARTLRSSRSAGWEIGTKRLDFAVLGSVTTGCPSIRDSTRLESARRTPAVPAAARLLYLAADRGLDVELLRLATSSNTAGHPSRVVGYGGSCSRLPSALRDHERQRIADGFGSMRTSANRQRAFTLSSPRVRLDGHLLRA